MSKRLMGNFKLLGIKGLYSAIKAKFTTETVYHEVNLEGYKFPFYLRMYTSDVPTYKKIFVQEDYGFRVNKEPSTIIDAGANIGLASIYFANKYPLAKVIAIEPEENNFALLKKNTKYYPNIIAVNAALWDKNEDISLFDSGRGSWGFTTGDVKNREGDSKHLTKAMTVEHIMGEYNMSTVDILKVDIEGAEKEVFADTSKWIENVDSVIAELHERMKQGCNRNFYTGTPGFKFEWRQGENVYLSKGNYIVNS